MLGFWGCMEMRPRVDLNLARVDFTTTQHLDIPPPSTEDLARDTGALQSHNLFQVRKTASQCLL